MNIVDKATATQLTNIEKKTGKTIAELVDFALASGLSKHSEIRDLFKREFGLGYGDANALAQSVTKAQQTNQGKDAPESQEGIVDALYHGPKASLRPIHEKIMREISAFGPFEIAPKKTYLSLRRKKQFAMVGPATNTRVEVGLNLKGVEETGRLAAQPAGSMCNFKVRLSSEDEVDADLIGWMRAAYEQSG